MYITLGLMALYAISSSCYNYSNKYRANDYLQKAGASLAVMQGNLLSLFNGHTSYKILLSEEIKFIPNYYNKRDDLSAYIAKFGVHNMQAALGAIIEGSDLEELPYIYMPYHQYIKSGIGMIELGLVYQQCSIIRLLYDYQAKSLGTFRIIDIYGIESISILRLIGADFSSLSESDIGWIVKKYGKDSIALLKDAGVDFGKLGLHDIILVIKGHKHSAGFIDLSRDAGLDFSKLGGEDISVIIKGHEHSAEFIDLLRNAGADFSKLDGYYREDCKEYINFLKSAGPDFSELDGYNIQFSICKNIGEFIALLKDAGDNIQIIGEYEF